MAIQPVRPAGSSYRIKFVGSLVVQSGSGPQTENAAFPPGTPTSPIAGTSVQVRFALADMTNLNDPSKRLPSSVYDYDPAGQSNIKLNDWAQNAFVRIKEQRINVGNQGFFPIFSHIADNEFEFEWDTTTTGLLQGTGVPVLAVWFYFSGLALPVDGVPITVDVWFPPSNVR